jgi:hypothetical protein
VLSFIFVYSELDIIKAEEIFLMKEVTTDNVRIRVRVRVTLRLAVYRPSVRLGAKSFETHDHYFFQLYTWFYKPYVTSSLTRGCICHLQLLLALASAVILKFEARGTHDYILLSKVWDFSNLEGQVLVFISLRKRVPQLYPQALVPFSSPPTTSRARVFETASARGKIDNDKHEYLLSQQH